MMPLPPRLQLRDLEPLEVAKTRKTGDVLCFSQRASRLLRCYNFADKEGRSPVLRTLPRDGNGNLPPAENTADAELHCETLFRGHASHILNN